MKRASVPVLPDPAPPPAPKPLHFVVADEDMFYSIVERLFKQADDRGIFRKLARKPNLRVMWDAFKKKYPKYKQEYDLNMDSTMSNRAFKRWADDQIALMWVIGDVPREWQCNTFYEGVPEMYEDFLAGMFMVAMRGDTVVGYVSMQHTSFTLDPVTKHVTGISGTTLDKYPYMAYFEAFEQGCGTGKAMFKLMAKCLEDRATCVENGAYVNEPTEKAIGFWQHMGFEPILDYEPTAQHIYILNQYAEEYHARKESASGSRSRALRLRREQATTSDSESEPPMRRRARGRDADTASESTDFDFGSGTHARSSNSTPTFSTRSAATTPMAPPLTPPVKRQCVCEQRPAPQPTLGPLGARLVDAANVDPRELPVESLRDRLDASGVKYSCCVS